MKILNTIKIISLLALAAFCLSSCGERENPMLQPQMISSLEKQIIDKSPLKDRLACVEYAANSASFAVRQPFCSEWMQKQYKNYIEKTKFDMAMASVNAENSPQTTELLPTEIPTIKEFIAPKVWQIIWNTYGSSWQMDLMKEKMTQELDLKAEEVKKALEEQKAALLAQQKKAAQQQAALQKNAAQQQTAAQQTAQQQQAAQQKAAQEQAAAQQKAAQEQQAAQAKKTQQTQTVKKVIRRAINRQRLNNACDDYPNSAGCHL